MQHGPDFHIGQRRFTAEQTKPFGEPADVTIARRAITACRDTCEPCFDQAVDVLANTPTAMVAFRRISCNEMGLPLMPMRGSIEEQRELEGIAAYPIAHRRDTLTILIEAFVEQSQQNCPNNTRRSP